MRKDFSNINYKSVISSEVEKSTSPTYTCAEQIELKNSYSVNDLKEAEHLHFAAGIPPFLRGPYSSMYVQNPWTI
ncbi:MAG TPA: methylmalonyl-CoA mutase family protein, partial [Bacteroidia bacterium]